MKITVANTTVEYIHVNAQGYNSQGRYFGTGEKVYRLDPKELNAALVSRYGHETARLYVRAANAKAARAEATAQGFTVEMDAP